MLWGMWAEGRPDSEVVATIARHGPVPADWSWWAADALALVDADDIYEVPFEDVRGTLADAGVAVEGVPSEG
jgi:hypothetical protein